MVGRAAVFPLGGGNPPPAPEAAGLRRVRHLDAGAEVAKGAKILAIDFCILLQIFFGGVLVPPYSPSRSPAHSAGLPQEFHPRRLFCDQNLDLFLASIFYRFWAVLGCHLGVIFGTFGGQVAPSSVQNASWKLINVKNVNFQQILGIPIPERYFRAQDGLRNAPSSAQDGSKRLLESNFCAFENPFKF